MTIPLWRRCALALITLAFAAVLFRGQLAAALITRGDDALRGGDRLRAVVYYRRALLFDRRSTTAADRLAFYLDLHRTPADARAAIEIATAALQRSDEPALLVDRALAEQYLHRWAAAEADFARAGDVAHDPRYEHFAGRVALVRGDRTAARHYFHVALEQDTRFAPARAALAMLR